MDNTNTGEMGTFETLIVWYSETKLLKKTAKLPLT